MPEAVVYVIEHVASGKKYVGSTNNWKRRLSEHRTTLRGGRHCNKHLQAAWAKHGEAAFVFAVVEHLPSLDGVVGREQHWIDTLKAAEGGFNMCPAAGTTRGMACSPEKKARISAANTGRVYSEASRALIREARAKQPITPESAAKTQAANTGKKRTDAFRVRISEALTGVPKSAEHKAKIAAVRTGTKASEETKAKMSASAKLARARRKALNQLERPSHAPTDQ